MNRLVVKPEHAALINQQKPHDNCPYTGGAARLFCRANHGEQPPVVPWWPSPDQLPLGPVEIVAHVDHVTHVEMDGGRFYWWCEQQECGPHESRPGEVVATAVVTDALPVVAKRSPSFRAEIVSLPERDWLALHGPGQANGKLVTDLSDLVAFGFDFQPGHWAVALGEVEPS